MNTKPDKENSTFYHRIFFKTDIRYRRGWSKAIGYSEPQDPVTCLQNVIVRLRTGAYTPIGGYDSKGNRVDPTQSIIFYHNQKQNKDKQICTIAEDQFEMHYDVFPYTRFWQWLDYFCAECRAGKSTNHLIKIHLNFNYDKLFSIDEPRFLNKEMLATWCKLKKADGHDPGMVDEMQKRYCEKWFSEKDHIDLNRLSRMK